MHSDASRNPGATHPLLSEFPIVFTLPVEWGDQDSFGHVNNTVYLRWCETARVVYLQRIGMWWLKETGGAGPILAAISCDFQAQVTFPDEVSVGARVTRIGNSSFRMEHRVVSRGSNQVVAEADSTIVFFDYSRNVSLPIPDSFRRAIEELEGKTLAGPPSASPPH